LNEKKRPPYWKITSPTGFRLDLLRDILAKALRAAEQRVWEEAATYLEKHKYVEPHIGPLWNAGWTTAAESFAKRLRQRATGAR